MGVIIASPESGFFNEVFLADKSIVETSIAGNDNPYFERVERKPLSFPLTIYIEEWHERDNLRQIARWLDVDYYKPLIFGSNHDRIYYAIFEGASELIHNGAKSGYITLNVRCDSPYTYSRKLTYDLRTNPIILNFGDKKVYPKFRIYNRTNNNDITVTNKTTNQSFTISNLLVNESVFIDMKHEDIISSLEDLGVYRYSDYAGEQIELRIEDMFNNGNEFEITGSTSQDFDVEIEFETIFLAD